MAKKSFGWTPNVCMDHTLFMRSILVIERFNFWESSFSKTIRLSAKDFLRGVSKPLSWVWNHFQLSTSIHAGLYRDTFSLWTFLWSKTVQKYVRPRIMFSITRCRRALSDTVVQRLKLVFPHDLSSFICVRNRCFLLWHQLKSCWAKAGESQLVWELMSCEEWQNCTCWIIVSQEQLSVKHNQLSLSSNMSCGFLTNER